MEEAYLQIDFVDICRDFVDISVDSCDWDISEKFGNIYRDFGDIWDHLWEQLWGFLTSLGIFETISMDFWVICIDFVDYYHTFINDIVS